MSTQNKKQQQVNNDIQLEELLEITLLKSMQMKLKTYMKIMISRKKYKIPKSFPEDVRNSKLFY